jgi:hypothetical protein
MYLVEKANGEPMPNSPNHGAWAVLAATLELLSRPGVWVGREPNVGEYCIETALRRIVAWRPGCALPPAYFLAYGLVTATIQRREPTLSGRISNWNDREGRTLAEVQAVLRDAIAMAGADAIVLADILAPPIVQGCTTTYGQLAMPHAAGAYANICGNG